MPPFLFVSYSRTQRPFAESLAVTAIEYGANVWFDLLSLFPGGDWQANIRAGIENCGAIILLVSRESLASPNVAEEIAVALAAKRPLYLAMVEATPLQFKHAAHIDLAASAHSIVDMRGNFRAGFEKILTAFRTGEPYRDAIPLPNRLHIPTRAPRPVAETFAGLLAPVLMLVGLLVYWHPFLFGGYGGDERLARASGLLMFELVLGVALQLGVCYVFLLRKLTIASFGNSVVCINLLLASCVFWQGRYLTSNPLFVPRFVVPAWVEDGVFSLVVALASLALYRTMSSPDLLRWMPPTDGIYSAARSRQIQRLADLLSAFHRQAKTRTDTRPYFYALNYAAADEPIAARVRKAFERNDRVFERAIGDPVPVYSLGVVPERVDFKVLIVTNRLSEEEACQFLASSGGWPLLLLASPIRLSKSLEKEFTQLQWVEFRGMQLPLIGLLVLYLRGLPQARGSYAAFYYPARFESLRGPNGVAVVASAMRFFGALCVAGGLVALGAPKAAAEFSPFMLGAFLLAVWHFATVHWLYLRSMRFWPFALSVAAGLAITAWLGVFRLLAKGYTGYVDSGMSGAMSVGLGVAMCGLVGSLWQLKNLWFPVLPRSGPTIAGPSQLSIAVGHLPFFLVAMMMAANSLAMK